MSENLLSWVAVNNGIVVQEFQATQEYIDSYDDLVVDREDRVTPDWYTDTTEFINTDSMSPKPSYGWYKAGNAWVDGTPKLTVNRQSIPADGTTAATVTFMQQGPNAPAKAVFEINGQTAEDTLVNGKAALDVTSTNPGDTITVSVGDLMVLIGVDV